MDQEKIIEIAKLEFDGFARQLAELQNLQEKRNDSFLKVKIAFFAFIGIAWATLDNDRISALSDRYLLTVLFIVTLLASLRIIYEMWVMMKDTENPTKKLLRKTALAQIRYNAIVESDAVRRQNFSQYREIAERLINQDNKIYQAMLNDESVDSIVKGFSTQRRWWLEYVYWSLLFVSIPVLLSIKFF